MASATVKPARLMKKSDSMKSHSWWWDSHISPKNSKWLSENLEEMDQSVKRMLKLIEQDADSFGKKAEMYYQKRPQLISHVEEFYRMYRSLAERYDQVTGELRKSIPSDLQSQSSGTSEISSEPAYVSPAPDKRPGRRNRSAPRPAGFEVFLGCSGGSSSDLGNKGDEEEEEGSSTLDSESDSDDSSINNYNSDDPQGLRTKIAELETELRQVKHGHEEEISGLRTELHRYKSGMGTTDISEIQMLEGEMRTTKEKLQNSEREIENLRRELGNSQTQARRLQEQFGSANKDSVAWKSMLSREQREVSKLHDRIARFKATLSERDQEIRELKESINNANRSLSEENLKLQADITKSIKEKALLEDKIKEWDFKCQSLEEECRRINAGKQEIEKQWRVERDELDSKVATLVGEVSLKGDEIEHLRRLNMECGELGLRVGELEKEIENQKEVILEGAEAKRQAIRQLCVWIEHYRTGYEALRHNGSKRRPVVA